MYWREECDRNLAQRLQEEINRQEQVDLRAARCLQEQVDAELAMRLGDPRAEGGGHSPYRSWLACAQRQQQFLDAQEDEDRRSALKLQFDDEGESEGEGESKAESKGEETKVASAALPIDSPPSHHRHIQAEAESKHVDQQPPAAGEEHHRDETKQSAPRGFWPFRRRR